MWHTAGSLALLATPRHAGTLRSCGRKVFALSTACRHIVRHSPHALLPHCCLPRCPASQASRWTYSSDTALSPDRKIRSNVVQRYHFSSNLRRMTATVEVRGPVPWAGPTRMAAVQDSTRAVGVQAVTASCAAKC